MGVPQVYRKSQEQSIATYSFADIISGLGYIELYAGNLVDTNVLSNIIFYSDVVALTGTGGSSGTTAKGIDQNFTATINKAIRVEGTAIANIPIKSNAVGSGSGSTAGTHYVILILKKNGATIVTNTSRVGSFDSATGKRWELLGVDLVVPATTWNIGDTLTLNVAVWSQIGGTFTNTVELGCDPKNRSANWDTSGDIPSQLKLLLPTKIKL
jgi:hypothetical protein